MHIYTEESEDALRECRVLDLLRDVVEEYRKDGDVLWRLGVCMRQIVLVSGESLKPVSVGHFSIIMYRT